MQKIIFALLLFSLVLFPVRSGSAEELKSEKPERDITTAFMAFCINPGADQERFNAVVKMFNGVNTSKATATDPYEGWVVFFESLPLAIVRNDRGQCSIFDVHTPVEQAIRNFDKFAEGAKTIAEVVKAEENELKKTSVAEEIAAYTLKDEKTHRAISLKLSKMTKGGELTIGLSVDYYTY